MVSWILIHNWLAKTLRVPLRIVRDGFNPGCSILFLIDVLFVQLSFFLPIPAKFNMHLKQGAEDRCPVDGHHGELGVASEYWGISKNPKLPSLS